MIRYHIFDHTADLGLEIYGADAGELFSNAAYAVSDTITDIHAVRMKERRSISVEGSDWDDLIVNFLREILYLVNGEGLLLRECSIAEIDRDHVLGDVHGEFFDPSRHHINLEIKAVTYHQASVSKTREGWKGRVIFDV